MAKCTWKGQGKTLSDRCSALTRRIRWNFMETGLNCLILTSTACVHLIQLITKSIVTLQAASSPPRSAVPYPSPNEHSTSEPANRIGRPFIYLQPEPCHKRQKKCCCWHIQHENRSERARCSCQRNSAEEDSPRAKPTDEYHEPIEERVKGGPVAPHSQGLAKQECNWGKNYDTLKRRVMQKSPKSASFRRSPRCVDC